MYFYNDDKIVLDDIGNGKNRFFYDGLNIWNHINKHLNRV